MERDSQGQEILVEEMLKDEITLRTEISQIRYFFGTPFDVIKQDPDFDSQIAGKITVLMEGLNKAEEACTSITQVLTTLRTNVSSTNLMGAFRVVVSNVPLYRPLWMQYTLERSLLQTSDDVPEQLIDLLRDFADQIGSTLDSRFTELIKHPMTYINYADSISKTIPDGTLLRKDFNEIRDRLIKSVQAINEEVKEAEMNQKLTEIRLNPKMRKEITNPTLYFTDQLFFNREDKSVKKPCTVAMLKNELIIVTPSIGKDVLVFKTGSYRMDPFNPFSVVVVGKDKTAEEIHFKLSSESSQFAYDILEAYGRVTVFAPDKQLEKFGPYLVGINECRRCPKCGNELSGRSKPLNCSVCGRLLCQVCCSIDGPNGKKICVDCKGISS